MDNASADLSDLAGEQVIARLRRHARILFLPAVLTIAVCTGAGYASGFVTGTLQVVLLWSAAVVLVVVVALLPYAFWLTRRYTVTDRRLILRWGLFVRVRQDLLHSRGYDITVTKTWLQSAFRSGTIRINSGLEHPVVLKDVPRVDQLQQALTELMDKAQNIVSIRRQQAESVEGDTTAFWGSR